MPVGKIGRRSSPGRRSVARSCALGLAVAVASLGLAPVAVAQDGFSDVAGGAHKPAIDALDEMGLFERTECAEGEFCPRHEMKRWTVAVWLVRALDDEEPAERDETSFDDVDADAWWMPYAERLAELEVTSGCKTEPLRFCPDESVTRAQMATFLVRAFDLEDAPPAGFGDTEDNRHEASIDALAASGITAGCETEPLNYCPRDPVTRAQMATFLARALGVVELPASAAEPEGEAETGEPSLPSSGTYRAVAAGRHHSCALTTAGEIVCWPDLPEGVTFVPRWRP